MTPIHDISHVTDSAKDAQAIIESLQQQLRLVQEESQSRIQGLEADLASTQQRLQEHVDTLSKLQTRYERRTTQSHGFRQERDRLVQAAKAGEERRAAQIEQVAKLKSDKTTLEAELVAAREALKGTPGHVAELEVAREKARTLEQEKTSLESRLQNVQNDFLFLRDQYQAGSTNALENSRRISDLEDENKELKFKASGEVVKHAELKAKNEIARYLTRVTELEYLLANREDLLRKKEEELRIKGRGVTTRSNSVQPRSPRMAGRGDVSRGSSPAPGGLMPRGSALRFSGDRFQ